MKALTFTALVVGLLFYTATARSQEKQVDSQKQQQMMEMMQDSTMFNMMMEHIANHDHMRTRMMQQLIESARSDTSWKMNMCKMMLENQHTHSMMMRMMEGGMMRHQMMEKPPHQNMEKPKNDN